MKKPPRSKVSPSLTIQNCTFQKQPPNADVVAAVRAIAEAARANAVAIAAAAEVIRDRVPMLSVGMPRQ